MSPGRETRKGAGGNIRKVTGIGMRKGTGRKGISRQKKQQIHRQRIKNGAGVFRGASNSQVTAKKRCPGVPAVNKASEI